ncbi:MAG: ATP synthase F1 subunit delta [Phycisphaerae bacterium]
MKAVSLQPPSVMDPVGLSLADVYAGALAGLLEDDNAAETIDSCLAELIELIDSIPQAHQLLSSLRIKPAQRQQIVADVFADRLEEPLEAFLAVLVGHGRFELLPAIRASFHKMLNRRQGREEVTLVSARPLSDQQRETIVEELTAALDARLAVTCRVDPDMLGGLVVQVGDRVYDASLAGQVEKLAGSLKGRRWTDLPKDPSE